MAQKLKPNRSDNRGGSREGAGRKKKEPTKQIRVPVSLIPVIERYLLKKR